MNIFVIGGHLPAFFGIFSLAKFVEDTGQSTMHNTVYITNRYLAPLRNEDNAKMIEWGRKLRQNFYTFCPPLPFPEKFGRDR